MTRNNRIFLQIEGAMVFAGALYFYNRTGYSWVFLPLFLLFDLSMLGYLLNKKVGALVYNLGHSYILPVLLIIAAIENESELIKVIGFLWIAHIGFDRMQGYGLKEETGFTHTHLGRIGKQKTN